jgi:small conductance mechanosensitive channel
VQKFRAALAKIPNVAVQPPPEVSLLDMNLVGPVIAVRPYTNTANYWQVYFDTNEAIVKVCRDAGWPAPTPSQIVRQVLAPAAEQRTAPAATG